jgi:uncharacterized protein (DUF488 family)
MPSIVYTIGHSNHTIRHLRGLLQMHAVTAIADIRSQPFSRRNPQFNRDTIAAWLTTTGIDYVALGDELGARSSDPSCYVGGRVQYELVSRTPGFRRGLDRIIAGTASHRIALMCAEKEPLHCHRALLVARRLAENGVQVVHILADGSLETHDAAVSRLLAELGMPQADLFMRREDIIAEAYRIQSGGAVFEAGSGRED